uniref:Transposase n=1 Tax=Schistosoma curassoni TaxID=6186 RepID=A0A183JFX1_9TREM
MSTNPVKAPDIRFSSSQFRKQHRHEKAVSRTSLAEAIYAWPCESISRGRADSSHSRPYLGIWAECN